LGATNARSTTPSVANYGATYSPVKFFNFNRLKTAVGLDDVLLIIVLYLPITLAHL